jgi:hypothetical protein
MRFYLGPLFFMIFGKIEAPEYLNIGAMKLYNLAKNLYYKSIEINPANCFSSALAQVCLP